LGVKSGLVAGVIEFVSTAVLVTLNVLPAFCGGGLAVQTDF
jgi:hypothetical protein